MPIPYSEPAMLFPVLAHILLVVMLYVLLGVRKGRSLKAKRVDVKAAALDKSAWDPEVQKVSNNIANQFESPVLFYALCLMAYSANLVDSTSILLAWGFVVARYAHAYVHVGSNFVPYRMRLFMVAVFMLLALLIKVTWQLLA